MGNIAGDSQGSRELVFQLGVLPKLVNLISEKGDRGHLVRHTTRAISNLCQGNPSLDIFWFKTCLPVLVHVIVNSRDDEVLMTASQALSRLISSLSDGRDERIHLIVSSGVVKHLVLSLSHENIRIVLSVLRTLGHLMTGDDHCIQVVLNEGVLKSLSRLLGYKNKSILDDTLGT